MPNFLLTFKRLIIESGSLEWTAERLQTASAGKRRQHLFITSFLILFFELACIRWIPAHVTYLGFFINFVLMATFLGSGLGILLSKRPKVWLPPFPLLWFIFTLLVSRFNFELKIPSNDVLYYGASEGATPLTNFLVLPLIFIAVVIVIIPLGRTLGGVLSSLPPLEAYAIDIMGSLAGIAAFFAMSYFALSPIIWFGLAGGLYLLLRPRQDLIISLPLIFGSLVIVGILSTQSIWSPYYRIVAVPNDYGGSTITVNNTGHQLTSTLEYKENFYYQVYDSFAPRKFKRVLIIGAGSGMDVALALHEGAEQVDAVEIDPKLYELGQRLNSLRPYADSRVSVVIDDGRAFMRHTQNKYDLILFALPDSLTLTSGFANLRLESFLFTTESLTTARHLLNPGGVLVLYNYYREDWLIEKLAYTLQTVFNEPPYVVKYGAYGRAAVLISADNLTQLNPAININYADGQKPISSGRGYFLPIIGSGRLTVTTPQEMSRDDWPFMYLPQRNLPGVFLAAVLMALTIGLVFLILVWPRHTQAHFEWHFFALGVAFMLLETRSLITFSLLFGSTWVVNSLVFFAILTSVLVAILVNTKFQSKNPTWLYLALLGGIALNYFIPLQNLLEIENILGRYVLAGTLTFLPIFLANVVFSHSFKDAPHADLSFGSNLLGAFLGGLLEYLALITGYQSLLLLALGAYLIAYLIRRTIYMAG